MIIAIVNFFRLMGKYILTHLPLDKMELQLQWIILSSVAYRYRKSISIIELFVSIYIGFLATNF